MNLFDASKAAWREMGKRKSSMIKSMVCDLLFLFTAGFVVSYLAQRVTHALTILFGWMARNPDSQLQSAQMAWVYQLVFFQIAIYVSIFILYCAFIGIGWALIKKADVDNFLEAFTKRHLVLLLPLIVMDSVRFYARYLSMDGKGLWYLDALWYLLVGIILLLSFSIGAKPDERKLISRLSVNNMLLLAVSILGYLVITGLWTLTVSLPFPVPQVLAPVLLLPYLSYLRIFWIEAQR